MSAVTAGLVNGHHHLYSTLARGMPAPRRTPTNFPMILDEVWWRLDRALDLELVRSSALLGAVEALASGTTGIVDHHSSPSAVEGSLDVVSAACGEVGVRVRCAYEATERNGPDGMKAGLAENERFLRAGGDGYVGAHACSTLSDASLEAVAGLAADLGAGVHIHVAEASSDDDAGARLERFSADSWLLAHCTHLDRPLAGTVAHNPRSNLNNGVGYARPARFASANTVVLGTDGIGSDLLEEHRLAYALHRAHDVTACPETSWAWLQAGRQLVPDTAEDRVTWNFDPADDPWHLAYTTGVRPVLVEVGGEVVWDGTTTRVDEAEIRAKAREQAQRLFRRMEDL